MHVPSVTELIPVLQTAISPMILISGLELLLLTMTNRLGRAIDRARSAPARYCRMTFCPSFNPLTNSVLTPLEIPNFAATLRRPFSAWGSGTSREVFRSLS